MTDNSSNEYSGVWVLGEVRDGEIHSVSYEMLAWGRGLADKLGACLSIVVLGHSIKEKVQPLIAGGADQVIVVDHPDIAHFSVDPYAAILTDLIKEEKPDIFIASATSMGRTIMPILAVKVTAGLTADCTELDIDVEEKLLIQTRPAVGGNIMATIKTPAFKPQMATVRPKSKRPLEKDASRQGEIVIREFDDTFFQSRTKRIGFIKEASVGAPIQDAETVVAFGKGLRDGKNVALINELTTLLQGSVGASRSAVDAGWIPYSHQVGLSGKTVSPRLYIACGISGAVQHLAGMSSAEHVVAINSDPEAPIFNVADYGIVGDIFEILPKFIEKLKTSDKGA